MTVNVGMLTTLDDESTWWRKVFDYLADKTREPEATTVNSLVTEFKRVGIFGSRGDVVAMFKTLEMANCGTFVVEKKDSRFIWSVSVSGIGRVGRGSGEILEPRNPATITPDIDWTVHTFYLRPDVLVEIYLPTDFTPAEADRVAKYVHTLSFK